MTEGAYYLIRNADEWQRFRSGLVRHCEALLSDGAIFVKADRYTHPRSINQNDMFRGLCREIAEHWNLHNGEHTDAEAVARDFKVKFGVIETKYSPVTDQRVAVLKSTTAYTKAEMAALITAVLAWAAEHRIPISDPRMAA